MSLAEVGNAPTNRAKLFSLAAAERSPWALAALGIALVALQAAASVAQSADAVRVNVALILLEGAVYLCTVLLVTRGAKISLGAVLIVAAIARLMLLLSPPYLSSDIYRYVWDGHVQGAGINPYLYIPNDPALAGLRDAEIWPNINRADYAPTIYPPVAQALFFLITRVTAGVTGMRCAWVLFEVATAWGVVRLLDQMNLPRGRLLIYAWSPLSVWEVAGSGHLDAAMTTFVLLAVLARSRGRDGLAGVALGLAIMVKFLPLVVLPALWRRWDWKLPIACAAVTMLGYFAYIGAGTKVFGFLPGYSSEEGLRNGDGFWFAQILQRCTGIGLPPLLYVALAALILLGLALVILRSGDASKQLIRGTLTLAAAGMIALSPSHPWYFLWLTPFLCFEPSLPLLWLIAVAPLLYWPNSYDFPWNRDVLYGGMCLLALAGLVRRLNQRFRLQVRWL